jgi:hypothetical protein
MTLADRARNLAPASGCAADFRSTETKKPACAGFDSDSAVPRLLDRADARGEAALVTCGLVAVDQATRSEAIENRLCGVERIGGGGGVFRLDCLENLLDGGAQHRTLAGVARIAHDGLLGALLRGLDVCHWGAPEKIGCRIGGKTRKYAPRLSLRQFRPALDIVR